MKVLVHEVSKNSAKMKCYRTLVLRRMKEKFLVL